MCNNKSNILLKVKINGLPPSVNNSYRARKGKINRCIFYKKKEVKSWQHQAQSLFKTETFEIPLPITFRLRLTITCYTHNSRRMDGDNRIKAVQDCLQSSGIIKDDSQIWDVRAKRIMTHGEEYTLIELENLD